MIGSLVKIEFPEVYTNNWDVSRINKPVVLDPFLMPGKEGIGQNLQNKNEWVPFHYKNVFLIRNTITLPKVSEILFKPGTQYNFKTIPVFILNGTLRI